MTHVEQEFFCCRHTRVADGDTTSLCTPSDRFSPSSMYGPLAVHSPSGQFAPATTVGVPPSIDTETDRIPELGVGFLPSVACTVSLCGAALISAPSSAMPVNPRLYGLDASTLMVW